MQALCERHLPTTLPRAAFRSARGLVFRLLVVMTHSESSYTVAVPTATDAPTLLSGTFLNNWCTLLRRVIGMLIPFILLWVTGSLGLQLARAGRLKVIDSFARFPVRPWWQSVPDLVGEERFVHA